MTTDLKPRRLRFSLRTLFVVVTLLTCAAAFVVYQRRWANGRERAIRQLRSQRQMMLVSMPQYPAPWIIRLTGGQGYRDIVWRKIGSSDEQVAEELRRLFPEAVTVAPMAKAEFERHEKGVENGDGPF